MLILASCGSQEQANQSETLSVIVPSSGGRPAVAVTPRIRSSRAPANYVETDGDRYLYVTAVSDEDRLKGTAAGRVVMYQYLGVKDGKHRLRSVTENGQALTTWECADPCRIITSVDLPIERIPFEPGSVVGGAFEDALAGRLKPVIGAKSGREIMPAAVTKPAVQTVPVQFRGEWNERPEHCGTALNETRLRITASKIAFYESDAQVRHVVVKSTRAIQVTATLTGEGQVWDDRFEFVLSRSGDDLSMGDLTRHRCD